MADIQPKYVEKSRELAGPQIMGSGKCTTNQPLYFGPMPPDGDPLWINFNLASSGKKFPGFQYTRTRNNPGFPKPNRETSGNIGGAFSTRKSEIISWNPPVMSHSGRNAGLYGSGWWYQYHGATFLPDMNIAWPESLPHSPSTSSLEALGTKAISLCNPTRSKADLAQSLAELKREGIAALPLSRTIQRKAHIAKQAGDEYLNVAFGWLPLVSESKDLASAVIHSQEILSQLKRDSGRWVRRGFYFPDEYDIQTQRFTPVNMEWGGKLRHSSNWMLGLGTWQADVDVVVRTHRRRWFKGAFTYYLPIGSDLSDQLYASSAQARKLAGLELNPTLLWELAPWSWAADWFANCGDIISNWSEFVQYGTILRYGYMMETIDTQTTYTFTPRPGSPAYAKPGSFTIKTVTKDRIPAGPFGFGFNWDSLSAAQLAIMGALGLSKGF